MQKQGAAAIADLIMSDDANADRLAAVGAYDTLVAAVRSFPADDELQHLGIGLLVYPPFMKHIEDRLGSAGLLEAAVAALTAPTLSDYSQRLAAEAIFHIARKPSNRPALRAAGACTALMQF